MAVFPGPEWDRLFMARINDSADYADAAAAWEGDLVFVYQREPDKSVPDDVYTWLDLWHGRCRGIEQLSGPHDPKVTGARFRISAPYSRWKAVMRGELEPVKAMMQGKMKVRGDLPTIVRYVKAANLLVRLAGEVPTEFVDEGQSRNPPA